ncbi:MAG: DISARM system phospholipase D-like protein DrmC [Salinibacterium amurskyense]
MSDVLTQLAKTLSPTQATSIAASLEIDGRVDLASSALTDSAHPAHALLKPALVQLGSAENLASVLRSFAVAASKSPDPPRAVWSGPTFDGDSDHTTAAVSHLIDGAVEDVFVSTFSATANSPFVEALWKALARGVSVTVVIDGSAKMAPTIATLSARLQGASFLKYVPDGSYGLQHSKVVIVDSAAALVTSANFSEAAAHKNLEVGVLIRDPKFASKLRQRFSSLRTAGYLSSHGI